MEEAITTQRTFCSPDKPAPRQFSRQNSFKLGKSLMSSKQENTLIRNLRLKETADKRTESFTTRKTNGFGNVQKTFRDVCIRDKIVEIFASMDINIQADTPVIDQLKLLEGKFEQLALEYRTIKAEHPDLFAKFRMEFYRSVKGQALEQQEKEKAIENELRAQRKLQRAVIASKNKYYRHPFNRTYLITGKPAHRSSGNLLKSGNDQSFLVS
jgi:hypothetical protein